MIDTNYKHTIFSKRTKAYFVLGFFYISLILGCDRTNSKQISTSTSTKSFAIEDTLTKAFNDGNFELVLNSCNEEINSGNLSPTIRLLRAWAYSKLGNDSLAIKDLDFIIDNVSDTIYGNLDNKRLNIVYQAIYNKSELMSAIRDYFSARDLLEKLRLIDTSDAEVLEALALTYSELDNLNLAMIYIHKAYQLDSLNISIINNSGFLAHDNKEFTKAIYYFSRALKIEETSIIYRGRAYAYRRIANFDLSEKDFLKAIELNPSDAYNYIHYSVLYFMQGNKEKGCNLLKKGEILGGKVKHLVFYRICNKQ